jgi:hypothetical protein
MTVMPSRTILTIVRRRETFHFRNRFSKNTGSTLHGSGRHQTSKEERPEHGHQSGRGNSEHRNASMTTRSQCGVGITVEVCVQAIVTIGLYAETADGRFKPR